MSTQPQNTIVNPSQGGVLKKIKDHKILSSIGAAVVVLIVIIGAVALFRGDSSADGGDASVPPTGVAPKSEEEINSYFDEACKDLGADPEFIRQYPGPAVGVTSKALPLDKGPAAVAVMEQVVRDPLIQAYWTSLNPGLILKSADPQAEVAYRTVADAWLANEDDRAEACERLATELQVGAAKNGTVEQVSSDVQQFSLLVYTDDYTSAKWVCRQTVPPAGLHLLSWRMVGWEGQEGTTLPVQIALELNAIFTDRCIGEIVAEPVEVPTSTPETSTSTTSQPATADTSAEATESTTATGTETGTNTDDGTADTGNGGSNGGGATDGGGNGHENGGCGNADCGDGGGGGSDCGSNCPGNGGGGGEGCEGDCSGEGTNPPQTSPPATNPPATQPPVTQPPATTATTTRPPVTQPPATTTTTTRPPVTQPPATTTTTTRPPQTTTTTTAPCPPGYTRLPDGSCKAPDPGLPDF